MKRLKTKVIIFLHRHFKRYRLRKICEALDIVPYPWQRDFALGKTDHINQMQGRATGKTLAVMLRLLMVFPGDSCDPLSVLFKDPDFTTMQWRILAWYGNEHNRLAHKCKEAGIPVQQLAMHTVYGKEQKEGARL